MKTIHTDSWSRNFIDDGSQKRKNQFFSAHVRSAA